MLKRYRSIHKLDIPVLLEAEKIRKALLELNYPLWIVDDAVRRQKERGFQDARFIAAEERRGKKPESE